jgi:choline kinase
MLGLEDMIINPINRRQLISCEKEFYNIIHNPRHINVEKKQMTSIYKQFRGCIYEDFGLNHRQQNELYKLVKDNQHHDINTIEHIFRYKYLKKNEIRK